MSARLVGYNSKERGPVNVVRAILIFAIVDSVLVLALVAALLYLHTDFLNGFGVTQHNLSAENITLYTVIAVAVMAISSIVMFFAIVWPTVKEIKNATR